MQLVRAQRATAARPASARAVARPSVRIVRMRAQPVRPGTAGVGATPG